MTLEIDVLTLFPAMFEGPLAASIPGRIQEQGLAHDPHPRPARLGPRPPPVRRRHPVRRGSGDDPPPRARRGRPRRAPPPGLDGDPARPDRRGLPPGTCRGSRHAIASHLRLPALRGRRRADPLAGRPRAVDRRLRPDRRRAAGAGRHRCRHQAPARAPSRRRRRSRNRSPTASSNTRSTPARPSSAARACRRSSPRATTAPSRAGDASRRSSGRAPDARTSNRRRLTARRGRAILRRRRPPASIPIAEPQPRLPR